jgi:hypothetical protein
MNRCPPLQADLHQVLPTTGKTRFRTPRALLLIASCALLASASAQTALRQFPPAALRGTLEVTMPPEVALNGQPDLLSPGARIRGPNNQMVMSGQMVGQPLVVNYLRNPQGQIHEVWILTADEAQEQRAGMVPKRNFSFGSDAEKVKTDDGKTPFDQLPKYKN